MEKYSLFNFIKWNNSRSLETFDFDAKPVSASRLKFFHQLEIIIKIIFSIYFNEFFFYFIFRWNINLQYAFTVTYSIRQFTVITLFTKLMTRDRFQRLTWWNDPFNFFSNIVGIWNFPDLRFSPHYWPVGKCSFC